MLLAAFALVAPACDRRSHPLHPSQLRFHAHPARRLFPHRRPGWGSAEARCRQSRRRVARQPDSARRPDRSRQVLLRGRSIPSSNRVLYSRGFASIYGEWETTPEFRTTNRTFHESVRFPWPDAPVRVAIKKRDRAERVRAALGRRGRSAVAASPRAGPRPDGPWTRLHAVRERTAEPQGRPAARSATGIRSAQAAKFRADADQARRRAVRARAIQIAPRAISTSGRFTVPGSPLSVEFNIFGLERYALTYDNRALRNIAAAAPYDIVEILVNESEVRRRRDFQPAIDGSGGERVGRVHVHSRACAQPCRARRRVCRQRHLRDRRAGESRAVGAEHHGASRSVGAEVARSRGAGHAGADADVACGQGRRVRRRGI